MKMSNPFGLLILCGERGIRTPGTSRYGSFQDYCNRPLYHLSKCASVLKAGAKVQVFFEFSKFYCNFFACSAIIE